MHETVELIVVDPLILDPSVSRWGLSDILQGGLASSPCLVAMPSLTVIITARSAHDTEY